MKYLHTMLRVKNLDEALDFFCNKLGLHETRRKESEKGRFTLVFLGAEDGGMELELTYNWDQDASYETGRYFGHLAYQVEDIYKTCSDLMEKGVSINRPPRDGYMAFIKSPDGHSIELLQKGEKLPPQEPWTSMQNQGSW